MTDTAMETALLEIAKDLLQASDDLAAIDPSASAKLAQEAYEIGRDLGVVRNHVDAPDRDELVDAIEATAISDMSMTREEVSAQPLTNGTPSKTNGHGTPGPLEDEDVEDHLSRILDRQKALLPTRIDLAPMRQSGQNGKAMTFEAARSKRSGWFGWMRPREWRHAG